MIAASSATIQDRQVHADCPERRLWQTSERLIIRTLDQQPTSK